MIYTIGNEKKYLATMKRGTVKKIAGGYAFLTVEDAQRRIEEVGEVGCWAVFGVDADWEHDTVPSPSEWWRLLARDADIVVLTSWRAEKALEEGGK